MDPVHPHSPDRHPDPAATGAKPATQADPISALVARRLVAWAGTFELRTPEDRWHFEQLVYNSANVEYCQSRARAVRSYESLRAALCWDLDRRAEIEELGASLGRRPSVVARRLETSAAGCRWLLSRWEVLARSANWTDEQKSLAFDLLGVAHDDRDREPWSGHASAVELVASERARLTALLADGLADLDAVERDLAIRGTPARESAECRRLRRDQMAFFRRYEAAKSCLTPRIQAPPAESVPPPAPVAPPRREPDPPADVTTAPVLPISVGRVTPAHASADPQGPHLNRRARRAALRRARSGRS